MKQGQAAVEDESPWAEEINTALNQRDADRIERIFGDRHPSINVKWTFTATNLTTGEPVAVKVNRKAAPSEVRVDLLDGVVARAVSKIVFPTQDAQNTLYEVRASAVIHDALGQTARFEHRLWSHVVPINRKEQIDDVIFAVAELAKVSRRLLLFASQIEDLPSPEVDPTIMDPRLQRGRWVRLVALAAAQDERVTIGELMGLVRGARSFAGKAQPYP